VRLFVHRLKFNNQKEWYEWVRKNNLPFIPNNPEEIYAEKGWRNWSDWLRLNY